MNRQAKWRIKRELIKRQAGRCRYCGVAEGSRLQMDHKYPVSRGGGDDGGNLQLLCVACNLRKGTMTDYEFRARYGRVMSSEDVIPDPPISQAVFTEETRQTRGATSWDEAEGELEEEEDFVSGSSGGDEVTGFFFMAGLVLLLLLAVFGASILMWWVSPWLFVCSAVVAVILVLIVVRA